MSTRRISNKIGGPGIFFRFILLTIPIIFSSCATTPTYITNFKYASDLAVQPPIPVTANVTVTISKQTQMSGILPPEILKKIEESAKEAVIDDLEENLFAGVTPDPSKAEVTVKIIIKELKEDGEPWGLLWTLLCYVGAPLGKIRGEAYVQLKLFHKDSTLLASYKETGRVEKWVGMYYGWEHTSLGGKSVTELAFKEAMEKIKSHIQRDREIIMAKIKKKRKPAEKAVAREWDKNIPPIIKIVSPASGTKISDDRITIRGAVYDDQGVDKVLINERLVTRADKIAGLSASPSAGDVFYIQEKIPLTPGINYIKVETVDISGAKSSETLYVEREIQQGGVLSAKPFITLPPRENSYAVIIGIDNYKSPYIPQIKYANEDAEAIYKLLIDPQTGGIPRENVRLITGAEATLSALKKSIAWLSNQASIPNSSALFYYSGHGAPAADEEGNFKEAYLVPYDTDPDYIEETALSIKELKDKVDKMIANEVIVLIDACFSGKGRSITKRGAKSVAVVPRAVEDSLGKLGSGKIFITASASNQISSDYEKEHHGLFTYYLLEGLKGPADEETGDKDGWVETNEVYDYVKDRVKRTARQLNVAQEPQILGDPAQLKLTRNYDRLVIQSKKGKVAKLKKAYNDGIISPEQLNRALAEIESGSESKPLKDFLENKISAKTFSQIY